MLQKMVIKRYFDHDRFERVKNELKPLIKLINGMKGEYSLQLRENYFDIYYQGNALVKVTLNKNGTYSAQLHRRFTEGEVLKRLEKYSVIRSSRNANSKYVCFTLRLDNIRQFFQKKHLNAISSNIRKVNYGEEIAFEQVLITDNPPSKEFIIIDRQVADHENRAQMDLLAPRRDSYNKYFHFVVIEVKLGKNSELREKVGKQLNGYVEHMRDRIEDYVACYQENYRQKKELGLLGPIGIDLPNEIEIDLNSETVEGLLIVGGYSQLAKQALESICKKINEHQWHIKVQQMQNVINPDKKSYCNETK
jgi:hypothetical protein